MFRLVGFLIGSLASIVIILLVVGTPNFHPGDEQADQRRFDEAIEMLKAKQAEFEHVADRLSEDVARVSESVEQELEGRDDHEPFTRVETGEAVAEGAELHEAAEGSSTGAAPSPVETLWYSFWNPFRSKIAAEGFVSQLERVTGLDYRIVKVRTGVYEVAFPYRDEAERQSKISRIAAATGLELPDS